MCADIFTKAFTDSGKWREVCWFINVIDRNDLKEFLASHEAMYHTPTTPGKSGKPNEPKRVQASDPAEVREPAIAVRTIEGKNNISTESGSPNEVAPVSMTGTRARSSAEPDSFVQVTTAPRPGLTFPIPPRVRANLLNLLSPIDIPPSERSASAPRGGRRLFLGIRGRPMPHVQPYDAAEHQFLVALSTIVRGSFGGKFRWETVSVEVGRESYAGFDGVRSNSLAPVLCIGRRAGYLHSGVAIHGSCGEFVRSEGQGMTGFTDHGDDGSVCDDSAVVKLYPPVFSTTPPVAF